LVDGTVVPCCIDAEGNMPLGNVFKSDLSKIITAERAEKIRIGFMNNKITEDFCKSCGFFV
jgi:radical SAM protein with 4Fe4S-binding SPASM domain